MSAAVAKLTLGNIVASVIGVNIGIFIASDFWTQVDVLAPVANTLLLIVLALLARQNNSKIDSAHESVNQTAQTAASAAECAAEAARVAKAIGSSIRTDLPLQPADPPPHE